jgi:hypothetical protein
MLFLDTSVNLKQLRAVGFAFDCEGFILSANEPF